MLKLLRFTSAAMAALSMALLLPGSASAQDRDTQEVSRYTLTEAGLAKYSQATKKIAALPGAQQSDCDDDDSESMSLDQMAAKFDATPGVKAAIQSAGMTTREYVVFMWSIFQNGMAAWALEQPGGKLPAGTSNANVDFYKNHQAEIAKLEAPNKGDDCGEQADEESDEA